MVVSSMSYAKYESYKDSGEAWIGEIPSEWEVIKLKNIFYEKKHTRNMSLNCGSISFGQVICKDDDKVPEATKMAYQEVLNGEFLINPLNLNYDLISLRIALSKIDVVVSAGYIVLKNKIEINKEFFKYLLHRYDVAYMKLLGSGVRQTINFNHIANSLLVLPTDIEQTKIANFLDQKTTEIDQAIALKQQQIEKLNEYKQIVIQTAVTKGLNPNAPMKDSGVEWIGDIPEHWDVKKNTHLFNKIGSGTTPTSSDLSYYDSGDINWLQTGDLNNDYIVATSRKINQKAMSKFSSLKLYDENSLVIAMYGATIGKVGLLKIKSTTNQACCVLGNSDKVFMKYIFYVMQFAKNHLISNSYGGGQPNINQDMIKNLRIPYPNLQEQEKIANYLDDLNEKIYKTSKGYQTQIDRLKEYKNILINQAVTGKIKI